MADVDPLGSDLGHQVLLVEAYVELVVDAFVALQEDHASSETIADLVALVASEPAAY